MDAPQRSTRVYKYWLIHYRRISVTGPEWSVGSVMNLSDGGVCFRTEERLDVGTPLVIQFNFPWKVTTSIRGTVRWQKDVRNRAKEYGVIFETMDHEARELINQFVRAWEKRHRDPSKDR